MFREYGTVTQKQTKYDGCFSRGVCFLDRSVVPELMGVFVKARRDALTHEYGQKFGPSQLTHTCKCS